ncbi:hypothetical protein NLI96_g6850 [Meripilus lineatus]|uniref:Uncharacterized protein n=1 Tax=Meripilus lineatus TaxID=2056292 RepID=A0AAD5V0I6_9APHY|nr:hypothetical protein NLI96_g6850 [Physisporinus lineatus]
MTIPPRVDTGKGGEILYKDQAKLFGRADSIPGENKKEAVLGLVWANIINARIMLTRTERMQDLHDHDIRPNKRRRTNEYTGGPSPPTSNNASERHSIRIRRLTVVFNQSSPPTSLDYVVTQQGISVVNEDAEIPPSQPRPISPEPTPSQPLAVVIAEDDPVAATEPEQIVHPDTEDGAEEGPIGATDDEWDEYWKLVENEDPLFNAFDFEALDSTHS